MPRSPAIKPWSLTTLKEKLIKIGAKGIQYAGYLTSQMAKVAIPPQYLPVDPPPER